MSNRISIRSGLAALAIGVLTLAGATASGVTPAAAGGGHGHGHGGGHGWGGHGHWGGHDGWGHARWRHRGPRVFIGAPLYVRDCYRASRTVYVPGDGYVRVRSRVCD